MNLVASYADPGQLVAPLGEIREALRAKAQGAPLPAGVPPAALRVPAALQRHQAAPQRGAGPAQEEVARLASRPTGSPASSGLVLRCGSERGRCREGCGTAARRPGRSRRRRRRGPRSRRSRGATAGRRVARLGQQRADVDGWPGRAPAAGRPGSAGSGRCRRCPRPAGRAGPRSARARSLVISDDARRHGGVAVAAHAQEVAGQLARDGPHQVGHEHEGAAQDADHGQRAGGQAGVDLARPARRPAGRWRRRR